MSAIGNRLGIGNRESGIGKPASELAHRLSAVPDSPFSVPHSRPHQGFTLIELLVVVVIIGVLAVALTLAVGNSGERQLANEAERFQALLAQLCNQAELGGREYGVVIADDGYAFRQLDGTEWHETTTGELRARHWIAGLRAELSREGRPVALATPKHDTPQLVCFSSGELTPFALTLALGDPPLRYRVSGIDDGTVKRARVDTR